MQKKRFNGNLAGTGIGSNPDVDIVKAYERIFNTCPEIPYIPQLQNITGASMYKTTSSPIPSIILHKGEPYIDLASTDASKRLREWKDLVENDNPKDFRGSKNDHLPLSVLQCANDDREPSYDHLLKREELFLTNIFKEISKIYNKEIIDSTTGEPYEKRFLKYNLVGPITLGLHILENMQKMEMIRKEVGLEKEIIAKSINLHAKWMEGEMKKVGIEGTILFLDEPYFYKVEQMSSIIEETEAIDMINKTIEGLDSYVGVHACAGNVNWGILIKTNIDVIAFDAFSRDSPTEKYHKGRKFTDYIKRYQPQFKEFMKRGGALAIGLIPNTYNHYEEYDEKFIEELGIEAKTYMECSIEEQRQIDDKYIDMCSDIFFDLADFFEEAGVEKEDIRRSLLTPGCGFGSADDFGKLPINAARGHYYLKEVSEKLKKEYRIGDDVTGEEAAASVV